MPQIPLILVPGIQGHWKYMQPAVAALSQDFRVLTFSLGRASTLADYADEVTRTLDVNGVERAVVCGVSFGGLIALRFAATRPERTRALVLASTPAPRLRLRRRHQIYTRLPWIFGPLFLAETPLRLRQEMRTALPDWRERWMFRLSVLRMFPTAPISFSQMAARARLISSTDLTPDCSRIAAPTLILTGEQQLDHVVPVEGTSAYLRLIPNACAAVIERTGHIGSITRPDVFASVIRDFVNGALTERHVATTQRDEPAPAALASANARARQAGGGSTRAS
jgi:pimeloyl-ACP methyl ester carboxylesterase